jgi:PAS domain S-box-containing protein
MFVRVLIVDDDPTFLLYLKQMMKSLGHEVVGTASSGVEALSALDSHPDLILMDVSLEGEWDGIETVTHILERMDVPVVYISGHEDEETLERARETAPITYILKPVDQRSLAITIDFALHNHRLRQELQQQKKWLHTTLNSIEDGVLATDPDGVINFVSPVAARLLGHNETDLLGRSLADAIAAFDVHTHETIELSSVLIPANGSSPPLRQEVLLDMGKPDPTEVEITVSPLESDDKAFKGQVMVLRDIHERIRIGRELMIKDHAIESALDGFVMTDSHGRITYTNSQVLKLLHCEKDEIMGKQVDDIWCHQEEGEEIRELLTSGESVKTEIRIRRQDGSKFYGLVSASPVTGEWGELLCHWYSISNISSWVQLQVSESDERGRFGMVGRSVAMREIYDLIETLGRVNLSVLIQGESGTGKELVARAIHQYGQRSGGPFIAVNCGAIPDTLIESELFGHVKGAFTGADRDRKGRFELAHGGTLFLDEIGELPLPLQVKLLRALQEGTFEPVGSEKTRQVDVRVISATNRDLEQEIKDGGFRQDLYYRLAVMPVVLKPLHERPSDIRDLVFHNLRKLDTRLSISKSCMDALLRYPWPGNVRELENTLQHAVVVCDGPVLLPKHLPDTVIQALEGAGIPIKRHRRRKLDVESVRQALKRNNHNKRRAARDLGVSRSTLYRFFDAHAAAFEQDGTP